MLAELRKALATTIQVGTQAQARVLAFPPASIDMPSTGVHIYVQPGDPYVQPYMTFSVAARAEVDFDVVIHFPAETAEQAANMADDLIDPMSDAANVFRAVTDTPTLGITSFEVWATPMLTAVSAPEPVLEADGSVRLFRLVVPVQIVVKRS